ncbi:hypothetical protein BpHYR1_044303 [Brachionus plicatilis]|uniref:Uncharacterized protein n=1 Tax=Brachionus plicatilis TaxID=10195 RepID=A0A3M7SAZ6_BRAPC|nr:hypothetical protein BpHYR1_044303 [Brachionus plicatilis]
MLINHLYKDTFDDVIYPLSEICHMQLWHRLFCESDLTYLVKMDHKSDMHFNDTINCLTLVCVSWRLKSSFSSDAFYKLITGLIKFGVIKKRD